MAEEKEQPQGKSSGSGNRRRGRRRYFKRKKSDSGESQKSENNNTQKAQNGSQQRRSKAQKNRRRRRRSRSGNRSGSSPVTKMEINYTPPESVFIYTHVLRPDQRDSYSFRSEISAGTGRTLDDFNIDLTLLFPDESEQLDAVDTIVSEASDRVAGLSVDEEGRIADQGGGDQAIESAADQKFPDETTEANHFQSEDDMPSSFA